MAELPILYSFRRCPYAIRARLALLASGTVCEIREVKLSAKPAEMLALSPKATVPVLLSPDGRVIEESLDIMRWALARNDPEGWLDRSDELLIACNDGPFKHHLDRYKYPDRHDADPAEHRAAALDLLRPLEARLLASPYLCGDAMGLADAALMPFVRQFAQTDLAWFDGFGKDAKAAAAAMKTAVGAAPRPATALPAAATATPARIKPFPTGRRRSVESAMTTTARVPREFPSTATSLAGQKSRWSWASGMAVPVTGAVSGTVSAIPTASPP